MKTPLAPPTQSIHELGVWSVSVTNVPGFIHHVSQEATWPPHSDFTKENVWGAPSSTGILDVVAEGWSSGWEVAPLTCSNFGWGFSVNPSLASTSAEGASCKDMEER